jgi:hypothetical protein
VWCHVAGGAFALRGAEEPSPCRSAARSRPPPPAHSLVDGRVNSARAWHIYRCICLCGRLSATCVFNECRYTRPRACVCAGEYCPQLLSAIERGELVSYAGLSMWNSSSVSVFKVERCGWQACVLPLPVGGAAAESTSRSLTGWCAPNKPGSLAGSSCCWVVVLSPLSAAGAGASPHSSARSCCGGTRNLPRHPTPAAAAAAAGGPPRPRCTAWSGCVSSEWASV